MIDRILDWGDDHPGIAIITGFLLVLTVIVGGCMTINWLYSSASCEWRGDKMNLNAEWTYGAGCRVNVNTRGDGLYDRWVDIDDYRLTEPIGP